MIRIRPSSIVGLLPMGGQGTRLAQPAPKPLLPTITHAGLVPLYRHALAELEVVTSRVYGLIHTDTCSCVRAILPAMVTTELALPGALGIAGQMIAGAFGPETQVALAFPDSIWHHYPDVTLRDVLDVAREDGAVALFDAGADELDDVILDGPRVEAIATKQAGATGTVRGWGAFIVRASALARMTAAEKDGPQLGRLDLGWAHLGSYVDLGTPERYIRAHDQREASSD